MNAYILPQSNTHTPFYFVCIFVVFNRCSCDRSREKQQLFTDTARVVQRFYFASWSMRSKRPERNNQHTQTLKCMSLTFIRCIVHVILKFSPLCHYTVELFKILTLNSLHYFVLDNICAQLRFVNSVSILSSNGGPFRITMTQNPLSPIPLFALLWNILFYSAFSLAIFFYFDSIN